MEICVSVFSLLALQTHSLVTHPAQSIRTAMPEPLIPAIYTLQPWTAVSQPPGTARSGKTQPNDMLLATLMSS